MNFLKKKWPFAVNALLLSFMVLLGLYLFNDVLGFSAVFSAVFGYAGDAIRDGGMPKVEWSWQIGILCGVFIGALGGSLIHGSWKFAGALEGSKGFFQKAVKSPFVCFATGFLVMFGAILSGEVFFGQLAAAMELSVGAWFFLVTALLSAGVVALFIERQRGKADGGKAGSGKADKKGDAK